MVRPRLSVTGGPARPLASTRFSLLPALLALGGLAPSVAADDEPWVRVRARPPEVRIVESNGRASGVVHLRIENLAPHAVRIDRFRMVVLRAAETAETVDPEPGFFLDESFNRPTRIDRNRRVEWKAICLDVPEGADRLRLEFDLSHPKKPRRLASSQAHEIPLERAPPARSLDLPFDGFWKVTQGHACPTNHSIGGFGGELAWDFVALGGSAEPAVDEWSQTRRNEDSRSFGRPILAPAAGRVVRVVNDAPDNEGLTEYPRRSLLDRLNDPNWIFGNFVVLDVGTGAYVLLAHLQEGSVAVREGDRVRGGDLVARCGNSGNTIEPHLHMQVMDHADPAHPAVRGLPAVFADYTELSVAGDGERREVVARRVRGGDPPLGSVIGPARDDR